MNNDIKTSFAPLKIVCGFASVLGSLAIAGGLLANCWLNNNSEPLFTALATFKPNLLLLLINLVLFVVGTVVLTNGLLNNRLFPRQSWVDILFFGLAPFLIGGLIWLRYFGVF